MNPTKEELADLVKEYILSHYPHLRGEIHVRIVQREILYEVKRGVGVVVETTMMTLTHRKRREIFARMGCAVQEVHAGLTSAKRVTGFDEIHS